MVVRSVVQSVVKPVGVNVVNPFVSFAPSPLDLVKSGPCQFWYDGWYYEKGTSVFSLNVNKVIQWDDKSGYGRHVANAVDAQRPTWDQATGKVAFNAAAQTHLRSASFVLNQPNTIFILYKIIGTLSDLEVAFDGWTNQCHLIYYFGSNFVITSTSPNLINGATNANNNIHCAEFNSPNSEYWINGILVAGPADTGVIALDGISLGCAGGVTLNADVEICEAFGYNCLITDAERIGCENYLTSKWGL